MTLILWGLMKKYNSFLSLTYILKSFTYLGFLKLQSIKNIQGKNIEKNNLFNNNILFKKIKNSSMLSCI